LKGTRPLSTDEIIAVSNQFDGTYLVRNRSLFLLGVSVGGRISELLSLRIGDVYQNEQAVTDLLFEKGMVKGKETARMIPVNADARFAITELIQRIDTTDSALHFRIEKAVERPPGCAEKHPTQISHQEC
jgi:site-specific recombinase XerD